MRPSYSIYLIIFIVIIFLIYFVRTIVWKRSQKKIIDDNLENIVNGVREFEYFLDSKDYFNNRKLVSWLNKYKKAGKNISPGYKRLNLDDSTKKSLDKYFLILTSPRNFIDKHNQEYEERVLVRHKSFFDCLENKSLDISQREAIIHEEDSNLVIAGAGCGKTTTLVDKVTYLSKIRNIPKEQILILAFTRKAVNEMKERIKCLLKEDFEVNTFHSFGYRVLSESRNEKPSLGFDADNDSAEDFIRSTVNKLSKNYDYARKLTEFFFYEIIARTGDKRSNMPVSYKGDIMKNNQEVKIANFLYMHGINYEYESEYRFNSAKDNTHYKPDFYLPGYDVYIEYFEINERGNISNRPGNTKLYKEEINRKRNIHKKNSTKLIESYLYEDSKNELLTNLKIKLAAQGIKFSEVNYEDIIRNKIEKNDRTILIEIISSFLNLFKSNQYTIDDIYQKINSKPDKQKQLYLNFLELFIPIYEEYQYKLLNEGKIDFSDMIAEAAALIKENKYISPYKYILIDEFQDISLGRYKLIKALLDQHNDSQLFCVGDDWQSIFKFAGSDVSLFFNFEKYFGYHKLTKIEHTYRFDNQVADFSNRFIMQNNDQIPKTLSSARKTNTYPYSIFYKTNRNDEEPIEKALEEIKELKEIDPRFRGDGEINKKILSGIKALKAADDKVRVLILGRYNWDEPKEFGLLKQKYEREGIDLQYLTIHKAKGLEADYVIINNVFSGMNGFPSEMLDHEILNLVLQEQEDFPYAEERRLFYVAMTRTKNKFYIIGLNKKISNFIFDLASLDSEETKRENIFNNICPKCKSALIKRTGKYGDFLGCSNFPSCKFTWNEVI